MRLKVVGTGSSGNGYVLRPNEGQMLLLEAGCHRSEVMEAIGFESGNLNTLLITHEHGDHAKHFKQFADLGMNIIASKGTKDALGIDKRLCSTTAKPGLLMKAYEWRINSFHVQHDAAEPLGFLLYHEECGKILFVTDFSVARIHTSKVHTFLVECNWDAESLKASDDPISMKNRIMVSHQSLQGIKAFIASQDLSEAKRIVLIHASSRNLDGEKAVREIEEAFGIPTFLARKGLEIELS